MGDIVQAGLKDVADRVVREDFLVKMGCCARSWPISRIVGVDKRSATCNQLLYERVAGQIILNIGVGIEGLIAGGKTGDGAQKEGVVAVDDERGVGKGKAETAALGIITVAEGEAGRESFCEKPAFVIIGAR